MHTHIKIKTNLPPKRLKKVLKTRCVHFYKFATFLCRFIATALRYLNLAIVNGFILLFFLRMFNFLKGFIIFTIVIVYLSGFLIH